MNHMRAATRKVFIVLAMGWATSGVTFQTHAQNALSSPTPAIQVPPTPALTTGSAALSLTAPNNTTALATNLSIANLSALLTRFQSDLTELLPVLSGLNNSFDFVTTGSTVGSSQPSGTAANFGSNLSANFSSNLGNNVAANVASPASAAGPGLTNAFGFPGGFGVAPVTAETLRALIVLQNDLERLRPTVDALTGNATNFIGIGLTPGFVPGPVSNVFGITPVTQ